MITGKRGFGGAPRAVGQKLRVNDRDLIVIGVAPKEFQGTMLPLKFELWVPATLTPALLAERATSKIAAPAGFR